MTQNDMNHLIRFLSKGIRYDGRKLTDYRQITVEYGVSRNAEGSARVRIGETEVLAGVKMSLETPFSDTPDQGNLMVGAELLALSNPNFEPGPPGPYAVEIARLTDRAIRESKAIDVSKLVVKSGEKVWTINVDICTINDAGNMFDASALATIAAIRSTVYPEVVDGKINYEKKTQEKIPMTKIPMSITVLKVGTYFIVDPTTDEEEYYDARLTVGCIDDGTICSMQKGGNGPITLKDVERMVELAVEKANELRKKL
jgi:exosome complex component RRP42